MSGPGSTTPVPPPSRGSPRPPSRDRTARLAVPVAALLGLGALLFLAAVDPGIPGRYPPCPVHAAFGLLCPGCGGLRAGHALTRGDLPAALRANAPVSLLVLAVPLAVSARTVRRRLRAGGRGGRSRGDPRRNPRALSRRPAPAVRIALAGALALTVFTVLRNLPVGAFLAP
ncbi:DUF2752 domain-containing protein [Streptomyces sp. ST2-7A]|uniref:DUF2752 domain-containing protein n=1 Tax=Streptomyces sp. ST2-7A TaxID=2907214 RepID=UPI001F401262|nr:DUF2752 domain-containing protein [Streptomyces sp. ST2-7A]MCE7083518.1 DUF2752 domain-containing protein [Streptomyces sp. ST2-7A]